MALSNRIWLTGWLFAAALMSACGGKPLISLNEGAGGTTIAAGGGPVFNVDAGNSTGGKPGNCKTSCDVGECGPIADGCGDFIECGGCTSPEVCGGAGVPSHCGEATTTCVPKTCVQLGMNCGMQSDQCGGIVNCWPGAGDAGTACPDPAMQCVQGNCQTTTTTCTPKTCADYASPGDAGDNDLCGPVSDGCGATIDCGFVCSSDKVCGLLTPGKCDKVTCQPASCESVIKTKPTGYCGAVEDGCGGLLQSCATVCTGIDTCGGGGVANICGHGTQCQKLTTADCNGHCGSISDGCGGTVDCGGCTLPATCGGGGEANICGSPPCVPNTCKGLNLECGSYADGCGNTLDCGGCTSPKTCGGGGTPNKCGAATCVPLTQAQACKNDTSGNPTLCGQQGDGCDDGVVFTCATCTAPNTCGGGGTANVCGAPACTSPTCQGVGATCGLIWDTCNLASISCGSCGTNETCMGTPAACVQQTASCQGLQCNIAKCDVGSDTSLSGTVYAPNGVQPLPNAIVYVPNKTLPQITTGPSCDRCEGEDLGSPVAGALTNTDGSFVLHNVPAGVSFPLVVKMGKWRRVVTIPAITTPCTNVDLTVEQTRLPKSMTDIGAEFVNAGLGYYVNIPHFAIVTGKVNAIECVLRKIGVDDSEFTLPTGHGRIHMYRENGGTMGCANFYVSRNGTVSKTQCKSSGTNDVLQAPLSDLFATTNNVAKINDYDIGVFDCRGSEVYNPAYDQPIHDWANAGGRLFASHYSYTYLYQNSDFATTATWGGTHPSWENETTGIIDTSFAKGALFNTWLGLPTVNGWSTTYGNGYIDITDPREYVQAVDPTDTDRFIYTDANAVVNGTHINAVSSVEEYAFNTPVAATSSNICGRVLYSAFHVAGMSDTSKYVFPSYCPTGDMTPQEKVIEYMIFDLSSCVSVTGTPPPISCTPKLCADVGAACGQASDGCGGLTKDCGPCTAPESCGGGGVPNQCGNDCRRLTCGGAGANCGTIGDGCGGTLDCGSCTLPAVCGGGGTPNICGTPACTPRSCADVGAQCGVISDGCGSTINCGTCTQTNYTCGGSGTPNVCGQGTCSATGSCGSATCGFVGDGCSGSISCGTCAAGLSCIAGTCTGSVCTKQACSAVGATCGYIGDGCGGVLNCGTCKLPQVCGGAGASQCGGACTARTCTSVGANCGAISDGCGSILECGTCPTGQTCGAGGTNKCGAGTCAATTCAAVNANCGSIGDGCGSVLDCGTCPAGQSCGGGGTPNQCGAGGCVPRTCAQQNANCGPVADGCGSLLDCGTCPTGQTCGGGGTPSQCGSKGPILT